MFWLAFTDLARLLGEAPGLTLASAEASARRGTKDTAEADIAHGKLRLRVGSTTITYEGSVRVTHASADTCVLELTVAGAQVRGSGTARGTVRFELHRASSANRARQHAQDVTRVVITPDIRLTGRAATLPRQTLRAAASRFADEWLDRLVAQFQRPAPERGTAVAGERPALTSLAVRFQQPHVVPRPKTGQTNGARREVFARHDSGDQPSSPERPAASPGERSNAATAGDTSDNADASEAIDATESVGTIEHHDTSDNADASGTAAGTVAARAVTTTETVDVEDPAPAADTPTDEVAEASDARENTSDTAEPAGSRDADMAESPAGPATDAVPAIATVSSLTSRQRRAEPGADGRAAEADRPGCAPDSGRAANEADDDVDPRAARQDSAEPDLWPLGGPARPPWSAMFGGAAALFAFVVFFALRRLRRGR
jgi:hypothetical protein